MVGLARPRSMRTRNAEILCRSAEAYEIFPCAESTDNHSWRQQQRPKRRLDHRTTLYLTTAYTRRTGTHREWLWGRAKLTIRSLIKKFEKDGLFGVYIAIFMIKNRIIDGLRFPQFKCTFTGLNAAALCHGSHGLFNTFDKRAAANEKN